jgi:Icc-related predicted phosphoesterase
VRNSGCAMGHAYSVCMLRLVIISDTHGLHRQVQLPEGDVLIHCGDFMNSGLSLPEIVSFDVWLSQQPHRHRLVIPGNHDIAFERARHIALPQLMHATYLEETSVTIEGVKFYGCPYTPAFFNWAFMENRNSKEMRRHWIKAFHEQPDVLISHGPPFGILDQNKQTSSRYYEAGEPHLGCEEMMRAMPFIHPKINCFGHIHSSHGSFEQDGTQFINASQIDEDYRVVFEPVVADI